MRRCFLFCLLDFMFNINSWSLDETLENPKGDLSKIEIFKKSTRAGRSITLLLNFFVSFFVSRQKRNRQRQLSCPLHRENNQLLHSVWLFFRFEVLNFYLLSRAREAKPYNLWSQFSFLLSFVLTQKKQKVKAVFIPFCLGQNYFHL